MPESEEAELRAAVRDLQARVSALESRQLLPPPLPKPRANPLGLTLVNRIGAITLAIGILFFFKYAADSGWIGPAARVTIGILTGVALIAASEWLNRHGQRFFSQGIAGCGLATLYISLYAASGLYQLLLPVASFLLLLLLCAATLVISVRRRNAAIAILGLLGALLTPQLIELAPADSWRLFQLVYLLVLNLTALLIASRLHSDWLVALTAALVAFTALLRVDAKNYWPFVLLLLTLAAAHFVYAQATAYLVAHCLLVIAAIRLIAAWTHPASTASTLASVLLALYGIALLALGFSRGRYPDRALGSTFLGLVIAKLYLYDIWQLNYTARITAFVVLGILLLLASFLYSRAKSPSGS